MDIKNFPIVKKIFTAMFAVSICFSSTFAPFARADVWSGTDWANLVENTTSAVGSVADGILQSAKYTWDVLGKNGLDALAYQMAQNLLSQLTTNIVTWIRGGFHGSPSFTVDTKGMAIDIADQIAGGLILSIRNVQVCSFTISYKDDLINSVDYSVSKRPYIYNQKAKCPFQEKYGFKASDFYDDFNRGGWEAFGASLEDSGNRYGVQLLTAQEQAAREAEAKASTNQKLSWSNGFTDIIDTTKCNYPAEILYYEGDPNPNSPDGAPLTFEEATILNGETLNGDPARTRELQKAYCKTTTPGKIVGDQLTKSLGVNMDRLGFADNMNKIVSAFLDVTMEKAVRGVFGTGDSTTTINRGGIRSSTTGAPVQGSTSQASPLVAVTTSPASSVATSTATFNGYLTFAGAEAQVNVWFTMGDSESFAIEGGERLPVQIAIRKTGQSFSTTATGLTPNTTYFFSAQASTLQAVPPSNLRGGVMSFKTLPI